MSGPRVRLPGVAEVGPGVFAITSKPQPRGVLGRLWSSGHKLLIGPPIPSRLDRAERVGVFAAVALIGSDMIASSVYGPEEMVRRLGEAGPGGVALGFPLSLAIGVLLAVLAVSYRQTINAYPNGAGGYSVARENLGPLMGVVAASALLIDYTLDVAVSVATGVQSITSAVPQLADARVWLCLVALALVTLANLRGIRAAGLLLSAPVYAYIIGTLGVVLFGIVLAMTGSLPPYTPPAGAQDMLADTTGTVGLLLLLRSFSSGAVALTGIEAMSNGVPYMKPPEQTNARRALLLMAALFAAMFIGLAFVAGQLGVLADPAESETVHSQVTRALLGRGPLFVAIEVAAVLMLILAVNTGFADFPRLLALMSRDAYLPKAFSARGSRLAFSNGIVLVAFVSALLLIAYRGSLAGLAPLFTIGAFLTFTISQAGMVRYWLRGHQPGWHWRMAANALGAATTFVVLMVVVTSKFLDGGWLVVVFLTFLVYVLQSLGKHEQRLDREAAVQPEAAERLLERTAQALRHHVLIAVGGPDRVALHAIGHVLSLLGYTPGLDGRSDGQHLSDAVLVQAVHVTDDREAGLRMQEHWRELGIAVQLVILESPFRAPVQALLRYVDYIELEAASDSVVTIVIPETLPTRWWHPFLRNYLAWRLKWSLLFRPRVSVLSVPLALPD